MHLESHMHTASESVYEWVSFLSVIWLVVPHIDSIKGIHTETHMHMHGHTHTHTATHTHTQA